MSDQIQDDTHDLLTKAYLEYFKAQDAFNKTGGVRTMREVRKWLREIRGLAKKRQDEVQEEYNAKKEAKQS